MTGHAKKMLFVAAACAWALVLASSDASQAAGSALDACRKWTGEGGGMQYKCFDCMKLVGTGASQRWVNTCPEDSARERP